MRSHRVENDGTLRYIKGTDGELIKFTDAAEWADSIGLDLPDGFPRSNPVSEPEKSSAGKLAKPPNFSKANSFVSAAFESYQQSMNATPSSHQILLTWVLGEGCFIGYKQVIKDGNDLCWDGGSFKTRYFKTAFDRLILPTDDVL